MNRELYNEILDDVTELVRREAKHGKISLSVETAELLERIGVAPESASAPKPAPDTTILFQNAERAPKPAPVDDGREEALAALREEVAGCKLCGLCETRTQTVFSDGSPHAEVVFVGEAPGQQEDEQGVPFVGRAGQLLTDIIVKGMKFDRQRDTYICNVIKCRPPNNRDPNPDEKGHCMPYLVRQLELIQPKVIVALGRQAAQTLLETDESTGRLRNRWHEYHGIPLRVTYHPAYLLRKESEKSKTWDDIKEVLKLLNGEITPEI